MEGSGIDIYYHLLIYGIRVIIMVLLSLPSSLPISLPLTPDKAGRKDLPL